MIKIRFELRDNTDKNGLQRLRIVVNHKGKRKYIATAIKLPAKAWDQNKQKVRSAYPESNIINNVLQLKLNELYSTFAKNNLIEPSRNLEKELGRPSKDLSFREFVGTCMQEWTKKRARNTIKAYTSMSLKALEFDPQLTLSGITPDWLARYEAYSLKTINEAGALKRVAFISVIVKEAIRRGLITSDPFIIYRKPQKKNPQRDWLTSHELKNIEKVVEENGSQIIRNTGTWFLLACYTGLRYSDIESFDHDKNIRDGRLILYTQKTGVVVSIKITTRVNDLLSKSNQYGPVYSNQKVNQYLKAIATLAGLKKNLTFHMARHTFAVHCANKGISQEVTSKLLGHSDLKTTSIYYKITDLRIDAEMEKWE